MKKLFTLICAVLLLITFAACTNNTDHNNEITTITQQSVSLPETSVPEQNISVPQTSVPEQTISENETTLPEQSLSNPETWEQTSNQSEVISEVITEKHIISGIVYDAAMNSIIIEDENGALYSFSDIHDLLIVTDSGIRLGASAQITYTGEIQKDGTIPREQLLSITVYPITDEQIAEQIIKDMSLEEKVGQMFLARCPESEISEKAAQFYLGGYTFYAEQFKDETPQSIKETIAQIQQISTYPLFIAVDEEGGSVNRVSKYKAFRDTPFLSPQALYAAGGMQAIKDDTKEKAQFLLALGINLNLAPVCDVSTDKNDFIFARSFGKDASQTAEYVKAVVEIMNEEGIGCTLKHFPGYGNNVDTHTGISIDSREYETFTTSDFLPFIAGIEANAGSVLVSHNIVLCMDSEKPASLSPEVHRILREELGFTGVIITDDLSMQAIEKYTDSEQAAVDAVLAGNDMLCCTDFEIQIPAVINAVQNGIIAESRIDESVKRILLMKIDLGLIN